jgi:hypothetical protein
MSNKMSIALKLAEQYFAYSNQSDMAQVDGLFHQGSTYYSANLGFFVGKEAIIEMQTAFHGQYQTLHWTMDKIVEIKPNVIEIEFSFEGTLQDGTKSKRQGREHILVYDGLIQHIAVGL